MNNLKKDCENCIIKQLNSLKVLGRDELKSISDAKIMKGFKKGETIFNENEKLRGVFCVRKGKSKLSKMSENGKDQIIKIANKGELLGQRSLISEEMTNLSATALDDMEVCFIPKKNIVISLNNNIEFTKAVLIQMSKELKFADNIIVNMTQKSVSQRTAEILLYLEKNYGKDEKGFLSVKLKREDMANIVGTAKEGCIRTLSLFKKNGWISTDRKKIKIENSTALKNLITGF